EIQPSSTVRTKSSICVKRSIQILPVDGNDISMRALFSACWNFIFNKPPKRQMCNVNEDIVAGPLVRTASAHRTAACSVDRHEAPPADEKVGGPGARWALGPPVKP